MTRTLLVIAIAACSNPPPPASPAPVTARGSAAPPSTAGAAAPSIDSHAATVDSLVGVWAGQAIGTPYGDFPFAIAFDRKPDGSVHGRLDGTPGMFLDFTFEPGALVETGAIPGVGEQTHRLAPAAGSHWRDDTVDVDLEITGDRLVWGTTVRGSKHSEFRLERRTGEAADATRRAIAARLEHR